MDCTPTPHRVKTIFSILVMPGSKVLIQVVGHMSQQHGLQLFQNIFTGKEQQQPPQGQVIAHPAQNPVQHMVCLLTNHVIQVTALFPFTGEPLYHLLRLFWRQVHQLFRVHDVVGQVQHLKTCGP